VRRRTFITILSGAAVAWGPLAARAQLPAARPLIVFLAAGSKAANTRYYSGFPQGMRELGYLENRDYIFEARYADGDAARLPALAKELLQLKPNMILAGPTLAVVAAKQATDTIPIVGINVTDPVGLGLVTSEARPGTNVTGILTRVEGLSAKQLEVAHDLLPGVTKIGLLIHAGDPSNALQQRETEAAATQLKLNFTSVQVPAAEAVEEAFKTFARERVGLVVVFGSAMFLAARRQIAAFALAARLPTICNFREHVEDGGLISYGINLRENYRRGAYFADRILKGAKPEDLPIEFPTKVELIINVAIAKALRLTIPPTLLARADEVIE
jgi:putative tryptophan/tyrosine transport system substrate-binding protein